MRIIELFEQTVAPTPPTGTRPNPQPSGTPPTGQVTTATQTTQTTGQPAGATTPPAQPTNPQQPQTPNPQQQQQIQQIQQASKNTLTDLDKIAAQIVGLKQKQQELQQQAQKVGL